MPAAVLRRTNVEREYKLEVLGILKQSPQFETERDLLEFMRGMGRVMFESYPQGSRSIATRADTVLYWAWRHGYVEDILKAIEGSE